MSNRPNSDIAPWVKVFESGALYRHDHNRLFEDWLDMILCAFANQTQEARYLAIVKRYSRDEVDLLVRLFGEYLKLLCSKTDNGGWYDGLGAIYEYLSSNWKRSGLGQFFTPESVCDMIARMEGPQAHESVLEPACGSGRMVLAARRNTEIVKKPRELDADGHTLPAGVTVCIDVDPVCVKMCAINMHLHGIKGEVACANALNPSDWRFAYQTHPRLYYPFVTFLDEARKEESLVWRHNQQWLAELEVRPGLLAAKAPVKITVPSAPDLFSGVEEPMAVYQRRAA